MLLEGGVEQPALAVIVHQLVEVVKGADAVAVLVIRLGQEEHAAVAVGGVGVIPEPGEHDLSGRPVLVLGEEPLGLVEHRVIDELGRRLGMRLPLPGPLAPAAVGPGAALGSGGSRGTSEGEDEGGADEPDVHRAGL